ncbi:MAG: extracellular solute-binding protein [Nitrospiraceae bacterium]|nr:extracellular solute-binding protein [Nitrospiraceae bacterium]
MIILFVLSFLVLNASEIYAKDVVIYTSVDQFISEPILRGFEQKTGIRVKVVYDVEASKTTGLINRLIAEKNRPKCDVFWNSEVAGTIILKRKNILAPYLSPSAKDIPQKFKDKDHYWTGFSARAHVLIYNTMLLKKNEVPKSIFELTKPQWRGKVALSYPLFGTAATHTAALYVILGKQKTQNYLKALKANDVIIVDGNSVSRDLVAEGKLPLGFTDTDDVNVAIRSGKPVNMVYPNQDGIGSLLIPNTIALIKRAPHPQTGKKLIDYMLSKETETKLAFSEAGQMPLRDDVKRPPYVPDYHSFKTMQIDYVKVAEKIPEAARFCQELFTK